MDHAMTMNSFVSPFVSVITLLFCTWSLCGAINTESIRNATEYQVKRARDYIQDNYETIINSGENYAGCEVYDMCEDPPSVYGDTSDTIDPWYESGTAWHSPLCYNGTLIGVRPNNHNPDTGEELTSSTCPEYSIYIGCDYDNSPIRPGIKIPDGTDDTSQDFLDATCFTNELEEIWTTRLYSNCDSDMDCYNTTVNDENETVIISTNGDATCLSTGICSYTETPDVDSFLPEYVEYQYYGDQRTGIISQIPALYWDALDTGSCPGTYDPRFRPWYAATASGPKDMILILDTSGSMSTTTSSGERRIALMREAAIAVLDTLTSDDYATVIEFSSSATAKYDELVSVTDANRCELQNFVDGLGASGGTNYEEAFTLAYEIMSSSMSSESVSGCSAQVILFLTDGEVTEGDTDIVSLIETLKSDSNNEGIEFKILTYGIGDDLASDALSLLKDISCANDGIYYHITNIDDDLSTTMASYYQMFVALREVTDEETDEWVVWIDYTDVLTGYRLIAANIAVYDRTTSPYTLLGVIATDVAAERLIDSEASDWGDDVGFYDDFDDVFADMLSTATICPTLDFDYDELQTLRAAVSDDAVCDDSDDGSELDTGEVIIIVLASVVSFLVVVLGGCFIYNKCIKKSKGEGTNQYGGTEGGPSHAYNPGASAPVSGVDIRYGNAGETYQYR